MSAKKYRNSEAKNRRWIKEGRGQGVGSAYKPWLTVRDVPSEGRSHRVFGHLTKRTHHLLSDLELATFLLLQWRPSTSDIREQFPINLEVTRQLCTDAGISHPAHQGVDQYMSSDFVVDCKEADRPLFALQVKTTEALKKPRTIEILEIERRSWFVKKLPWYLVTERQIPSTVFDNINLLYNHIHVDEDNEFHERMIQFDLFSKQISINADLRIKDLCIKLDSANNHEPGC